MYKRLLNKSKQREFDDSDSVSSQEEARSASDQELNDEENIGNNSSDVEKYDEGQEDDKRDFDITDPNLDVVTEDELGQSGKNAKGDFVCTLCPKKILDSMLAVREHLQSKVSNGLLFVQQLLSSSLIGPFKTRTNRSKTRGRGRRAHANGTEAEQTQEGR